MKQLLLICLIISYASYVLCEVDSNTTVKYMYRDARYAVIDGEEVLISAVTYLRNICSEDNSIYDCASDTDLWMEDCDEKGKVAINCKDVPCQCDVEVPRTDNYVIYFIYQNEEACNSDIRTIGTLVRLDTCFGNDRRHMYKLEGDEIVVVNYQNIECTGEYLQKDVLGSLSEKCHRYEEEFYLTGQRTSDLPGVGSASMLVVVPWILIVSLIMII